MLGVGGDVVARVRAVVDLDNSGLTRGLKESEAAAKSHGGVLGGVLKAGALGAAAGIGIATAAIGESVKAAVEAQQQQAKLAKAAENAGISWKKQGGQIEDTLSHMAEASGFMKGDLSDSMSKLVTVTGSATKAQGLLQKAMDISRATGKPLTATTLLVSKAYDGSATALSRMGIVLPKVTTAQDKLKASGQKYTKAQLDDAKAADLRAQRTESLRAIQQKFGGQSAAYANTAAGQWARFHSTVNVFEEDLGAKLLPALTAVLGVVLKIASSQQLQTFMEYTGKVFQKVGAIIVQAWEYVRAVWDRNSKNIIGTGEAIARFLVAAFKWMEPILKTIMGALIADVKAALKVIGDVIHVVMDVIQGHWGAAWHDLKQTVVDIFSAIWTYIRGEVSVAESLAGKIGSALWNGITGALDGIGHAIGSVVAGGINQGIVNPLNSLINNAVHLESIVPGSPNLHIPHNPIPTLSFARGGVVPGAPNGGRDTVMAMLAPGEVVLNRPQQFALAGMLGGDVATALGLRGTAAAPQSRPEVHVHQNIYTQTDNQGVHMRAARFAAQAAFG